MKPNSKSSPTYLSKDSIRLFMAIFFSVGLLLAGGISLIYELQTENYMIRLKDREQFEIRAREEIIQGLFAEISTDLEFMVNQHVIQAFLDQGGEMVRRAMEQDFLSFILAKKKYDQIRYLDLSGRELIRVNYNRDRPEVVPAEKLQNKSGRYYFTDSIALDQGQVFVSPLDLNIEQGRVERPFKPMIRFGVAVYDRQNRKRGVLLLNYLAENMLARLRQLIPAMGGRILLVNRNGYWLIGPDPDDEWGFMLPEREDKTLANRFPLFARQSAGRPAGQIINDEGMFSFTTIHPLPSDHLSGAGSVEPRACNSDQAMVNQYCWKMISYLDSESLAKNKYGLLTNLSLMGAGLFLLSGAASWLIAGSIVRRRAHQAELYALAHFDPLTGLPNRALFFDRLDQAVESGKRYRRSFAVLYIDLDDFKQVNDTLGHDAGDDLLIQASARMVEAVRKSDTVGRIGGDEFMIVLNEIAGNSDAEAVARKLLAAISEPFELGRNQAVVGACIGVSLYPDDGADVDALIKKADRAMYECKAAGKNNYRMAGSLPPTDC